MTNAERLDKWFKRKVWTNQKFADWLLYFTGMTIPTQNVNSWRKGRCNPSKQLRIYVEIATDGYVKANAWVPWGEGEYAKGRK